jgi:two-component system, LytTR family, sensor histidine kinase AlgZ
MTVETRHRHGRDYWLRVAFVSVFAALLLTALLVSMGDTARIPVLLRHTLIHSTIMAGLCGALMPWIRHRLVAAGSVVVWAVTIPALLTLGGLGSLLACGVIVVVERSGLAGCWPCVSSAYPINALLTMTLGVGMTLYEAQRARLETVRLELKARELEHERDRKMALQARLASLESRLQPHFLFNTLNAISALIQEDPDHAERMVERLSALLRFSLDATERGLVPLADELKIVTDYLEIEHTRLGERLSFAIDVPADVTRCEVPPLVIQILVENSVKHAIAPRPSGGRIRVAATTTADTLRLSVWDDGPGFTAAAMRAGHGLENLQSRLAARYGAAATLTVAPRDGGTVVTVTVPRAGRTA